jgi:Xaa-Pro dipeptidase
MEGRDLNERVERALIALRARGLQGALLASPHNVCYVSGYPVPIEVGPSPFAGGPTLAVLGLDGHVTLIVPNTEEAAARSNSQADTVVAYAAFGYQERYDQPANEWDVLRRVLRESGMGTGVLGIEPVALPVSIGSALTTELDATVLADVTPALAEARLVKTSDEIARLRRAIDLTTVGMDAAHRLLQPGMTENGLFAGIRGAMEEAAGQRLPVGGDLVAGVQRTAQGGGWPTNYVIAPGDLVLADLGPRFDGYWGDSCNTLCAGEPTPDHYRMQRATVEALTKGIEAAGPGVPASKLDAVCRRHVESYGYAYAHHSGHGLGTSVHESPRLVPYEHMPLQAGMVLALEPGAYVPGIGGVRSEHVILVTETGAQVLSSFAHAF